jgi:hypothetical protein
MAITDFSQWLIPNGPFLSTRGGNEKRHIYKAADQQLFLHVVLPDPKTFEEFRSKRPGSGQRTL